MGVQGLGPATAAGRNAAGVEEQPPHADGRRSSGGGGRAAPGAAAGYLAHVDGLRAISIAAVVAFHAGFSGFRGGFVGVDIFFVISGFLIINQIVGQLGAGRFSIFDFYARRALRILPSYGAMLVLTVLVGSVVLRAPYDRDSFAHSALYAPLFLTNFYFLGKSGYFDTGADLKPLLHTWSLAVEEQFYLVVPLLLAGLYWMARRRGWRIGPVLGIAAAVIGAASLIGCVLMTPPDLDLWASDRNPAFFMTWWRAWEFVAGGLVAAAAALPWHRRSRLVAAVAGLAGAALIGLSVGFVGLQWLGVRLGTLDRIQGFPGIAAALPVAGAMLVIFSGLVNASSPVAWLLSLRPVVFIGQISYALYLWHWPLLVFGRFLPVDASPALVSWVAIGLAVVLSVATRYLIELPILAWRRRSALGTNWRLAIRITGAGVVGCIAFAAVGNGIGTLAYHRSMANPMVVQIGAADIWGRGPCIGLTLDEQRPCLDGSGPVGVMFGDSHAMATLPRVSHEAELLGIRLLQLTGPGCNPQNILLDREASAKNVFCKPLMDRLDYFLPKLAAKTSFTIFDGYWTPMLRARNDNAARQEQRFRDSFRGLLEMFGAGGNRRTLVIGPLPNFERLDPFTCIDLSSALGLSIDRCGIARDLEDQWRARTVAIMREVIGEFGNIRFVDPIDIFCDARICLPIKNGTVAYRDDHHLNGVGAQAVFDTFRDDFLWAFKGEAVNATARAAPRRVRRRRRRRPA